MKNRFKLVMLIAFLFIGIFMPCLIRIRMQYVVFAILVLYISRECIFQHKVVINVKLSCIIISFLPFYAYYTILSLSRNYLNASGDFIEFTQGLSVGIYVLAIALAMVLFWKSNHSSADLIYKLLIIVGIIQLLCVLLSFISPSVKSFFNDMTLRNSFAENMSGWYTRQWYMSWRAYGLGENLFDGFGFVISIIISATVIYGLDTKKKSIVALGGIMLIMPLLNARTGLVLSAVSLLIIMFNYMDAKKVLWFLLAIVLAVGAFICFYNRLPLGLQLALGSGMNDITNLLGGEKTGIFSQIFGEDIVLPNDIIFGEGLSPERVGITGIDSGYIQCLWRFGLMGTVLLFFGFINSFRIALSASKWKRDKLFALTTMVIMSIYSLKLFLFNVYADIFLIFIIIFSLALNSNLEFPGGLLTATIFPDISFSYQQTQEP